MTYEESAQLMIDQTFRGRIKVAMLKYASFIQNEPPSTQGHSARYRWAQEAGKHPDENAGQLQPMVVMDPEVQTQGAAIGDPALQSSVEAVINKIV